MFLRAIREFYYYFNYFYRYIGYRIYILIFLGLIMGILDGFGIAMFIPLIEVMSVEGEAQTFDQMGKLAFLAESINDLGIRLSLNMILLIMLLFFLLKGFFNFIKSYKSVIYIQRFTRKIREEIIEGLKNLQYQLMISTDSGKIQNTLGGEAQLVVRAFNIYLQVIHSIVLLFVYLTLAFFAHFQFALLVLIAGIMSNLLFSRLYKMSKKLSRKITTQNHFFQGLILQTTLHYKYLKATGLIRRYADKLNLQVRKLEDTNKKTGVIVGVFDSLREPLTIGIVVLIILIQINLLGGNISMILLSVLFFYRAMTSVLSLQNFWNRLLANTGTIENMVNFSEDLKSGTEENGHIDFEGLQKSIRFLNVSYSYDEDKAVLKNIQLQLQKNKTIAIVGESGAGKTTFVNLLCGLMYPNEGELLIDEINIRDINRYTYQEKIGYITQESVIFNATIFENVTFWDEPNQENLILFQKALERAQIADFVFSLREKGNTLLGTNGINLSGGQRQRITIARELYKKVDILIMDEATSSLDSETEKDIQVEIDQLTGNYTLIVIAHRLSTVKSADTVVLLKNGKIAACGSYESLLEESADFRKMVELQTL